MTNNDSQPLQVQGDASAQQSSDGHPAPLRQRFIEGLQEFAADKPRLQAALLKVLHVQPLGAQVQPGSPSQSGSPTGALPGVETGGQVETIDLEGAYRPPRSGWSNSPSNAMPPKSTYRTTRMRQIAIDS